MDWIEIGIALCAAALLIFASTPRLRAYRLLNLAAFALLLSATLSCRRLGDFGRTRGRARH
jgi:hypothetical protein